MKAETVEEVGRARWREENQGFDIQKNSGLAMEHDYTQGEHFGASYLLPRVARLLTRMPEKGSLLKRLARGPTREVARRKKRVADLFEHRHLFVRRELAESQKARLRELTSGLPLLRALGEPQPARAGQARPHDLTIPPPSPDAAQNGAGPHP